MKLSLFNLYQAVSLVAIVPRVTAYIISGENATNITTSSSMRVGTARVDITPALNPDWLPPNEYELEKLYLRAIVIESNGDYAALIGVDVANIEELVSQASTGLVSEYLNTSVSNIVMSCTHTHGAAQCGKGLFFTSHNYGNQELGSYPSLADAALTAVKEAVTKMQPAAVGHNTGAAYLNVNRDNLSPLTGRWTQFSNFSGPVDHEHQALTFV